jgi:hypothetical protein
VFLTETEFHAIALDRASKSFLSAPMIHRYEVLLALVFDGDVQTRNENIEFEALKKWSAVVMNDDIIEKCGSG